MPRLEQPTADAFGCLLHLRLCTIEHCIAMLQNMLGRELDITWAISNKPKAQAVAYRHDSSRALPRIAAVNIKSGEQG